VEVGRQPVVLEGDVASPVNPPPACLFHTRWPGATEICSQDEPPLAEYESDQAAACHHPRNVDSSMKAGAEVASDSPGSAAIGSPSQSKPRRRRVSLVTRVLRVLALDYGTARCGCAISDPTGTLVRPLEAIEPPNPAAVAELVAAQGADRVIVGLPTALSGAEGEQALLSRAFVAELTQLLDMPVETYDERLTTRMADRSAREGARADRDSLAAAHLLESYLASQQGEA